MLSNAVESGSALDRASHDVASSEVAADQHQRQLAGRESSRIFRRVGQVARGTGRSRARRASSSGLADDVGGLVDRQPGVDRYDDDADPAGAEERDRPLQTIGQPDAEPVSLPYAKAHQAAGRRGRPDRRTRRRRLACSPSTSAVASGMVLSDCCERQSRSSSTNSSVGHFWYVGGVDPDVNEDRPGEGIGEGLQRRGKVVLSFDRHPGGAQGGGGVRRMTARRTETTPGRSTC